MPKLKLKPPRRKPKRRAPKKAQREPLKVGDKVACELCRGRHRVIPCSDPDTPMKFYFCTTKRRLRLASIYTPKLKRHWSFM